jgi:pyridoxine kinase
LETDRTRALPLLGSIQNSVGCGFLGNEAVTAIANRLRVRTITVPTAYASARGGIDGRMTVAIDPRDFRRGVEFLIAQHPAVLVVGYLPRPEHAEIVAAALPDFRGLVVLDPVLGSYERGMYVSVETARVIRDRLVPHAQVITPNRFEAEVLLDLTRDRAATERAFLDGFMELGPETVVVTSFVRDAERRQAMTLFSNGYVYARIFSPLHTGVQAYGAGDVFAAGLAALLATGSAQLPAALFATALASLAVERATGYGGGSVDPVAALDVFKPMPNLDEDLAPRYAERFGVTFQALPSGGSAVRPKFAPPRNPMRS